MNFHRDGHGGYVGESDTADASAKIRKVVPTTGRGYWVVKVYVFGQLVDTRTFGLIADAKFHAQEAAGFAAHWNITDLSEYPAFDGKGGTGEVK